MARIGHAKTTSARSILRRLEPVFVAANALSSIFIDQRFNYASTLSNMQLALVKKSAKYVVIHPDAH
jgi:hypothetical protein